MGSNVYVGRTHRQVLDDGTVNAATLVGTNGADWSLALDTTGRVRHVVEETANQKTETIYPTLWYLHPNGTNVWTRAATSGTAVIMVTGAYASDGDVTTERLGYTSGGPTFTGGIYCDDNDNAHGVSLRYTYTEVEFCFQINSAIVSTTDTVQLRVYNGNTALNSYDDTPVITATAGAPATRTIDVDDGLTLGESVSVDPLLLEPIDVDDGVTVADTPTVSLQEAETLVPSVSDNLGIGESVEITPLLLEGISIADGVTVGDVPALDPLALEGISVADGVTVGESTAANLGTITGTIIVGEVVTVVVTEGEVTEYDVSVSDGLGVGEAVTITPLELEDLEVSDDLTVGESVSVDPLAIEADSVSDSITLGESVSITPLLLEGVDVSDNLGVGESVAVDPLLLVGVGVSDSVSLGESVTIAPLVLEGIAVQDGLTLADTPTIAPLVLEGIAVEDGVTLTDAPELSLPEIGTITVSVSDSVAIGEDDQVYPPDTVIMIDHEEGDLSDYTDTDSYLSAAVGAAMDGTSYGLEYSPAVAGTYFAKYYLSQTIETDIVRMRFYFDPNSFADTNNSIARVDFWESILRTKWAVSLSYSSGWRLRQTLYDDGGAPHTGNYINISDEPLYIECMIVRATSAVANDSYSVMWINGQSDTVSGVDNYDLSAYFYGVDFGGSQPSTQGAVYFDEIIVNISGEVIGGTILHINVSDGLTIGESISIDPLILADVSVFDGLTVGESVSVTMALEGVSVSDGLTIGDTPDLSLSEIGTITISVSDTVAIGESVSAAMALEGVTVSDSVTIADAPSLSVQDVSALTIGVEDGLTIAETVKVNPPDVLAWIDHEEGDLSDWDLIDAQATGYFSATVGAAMNGSTYGLEAIVYTIARTALKNLGFSSNQYALRFFFDPNTIEDVVSNLILIRSNVLSGRYLFEIALSYSGGHLLRVRMHKDNLESVFGSYVNISDEPVEIEIHAYRATSDIAADGYSHLWINGAYADSVFGVDNYDLFGIAGTLRVGGVANNDPGGVTIYFDDLTLNVTGEAIGDLQDMPIVVSDGIVVGESVETFTPELNIDVSDGLTVDESVNVTVGLSVFDNITLAESVGVTVSSPNISISDSLAVGESVTVAVISQGLVICEKVFDVRTTSGQQTLTLSELGGLTPFAAQFICVRSSGTLSAQATYSWGVTDGTNQQLASVWLQDNQPTARIIEYPYDDAVVSFVHVVGEFASFVSFGPNEIVIDWIGSTGVAYKLYVIAYAGDGEAKVGSIPMGDTVEQTVDVTDIGFEPDLLLVSSVADLDNLDMCFGYIHNGDTINQRSVWFGMEGEDSPTNPIQKGMYNNYGIQHFYVSNGLIDWYGIFHDFDSQGFSVTPYWNGANNTDIIYLALRITTPSETNAIRVGSGVLSSASDNIHPGVAPGHIQIIFSNDYFDGIRGFGFSHYDTTRKLGSMSWNSEKGVTTTNENSYAYLSDGFSIPMDDGTDGYIADRLSWDTNGISIDWLNFPDDPYPISIHILYLAIGELAYSDISQSDGITLGDSVSIYESYNLSTLDSITIAESHSVPPIILPIHELENITVGESVTEPILWQTYGSINNVYPIEAESRVIVVEQEDRIYSIAQEQRVVIIEQE